MLLWRLIGSFDDIRNHTTYCIRHEKYGQHLSREEADFVSQPHPDAVRSLTEWIKPFSKEEPIFFSSSNTLNVTYIKCSLIEKAIHIWSKLLQSYLLSLSLFIYIYI
jgi:hypothetical protein